MKASTAIAISILSLAAMTYIVGCSERVREVSPPTYAVSPPPQVVVQPPAQVVVSPPPAPPVVVTPPSTVSTTEEKSSSDSTETGDSAVQERTNAYHSETSTVTPMTVNPAPPVTRETTTTTTY